MGTEGRVDFLERQRPRLYVGLRKLLLDSAPLHARPGPCSMYIMENIQGETEVSAEAC